MNSDFQLSSYTYKLPQSLIAQTPAVPRDSSRLLIVNSRHDRVHGTFGDLVDWLKPGDLLVLNNTRVIPARLYGHKNTGSQVEILLVEERSPDCWLALVKPGKRFNLGAKIIFDRVKDYSADGLTIDKEKLQATVIERDEETGGRILQFELPQDKSLWQLLEDYGQLPLPPYISNNQALERSLSDGIRSTARGDRCPHRRFTLHPRIALKAQTAGD